MHSTRSRAWEQSNPRSQHLPLKVYSHSIQVSWIIQDLMISFVKEFGFGNTIKSYVKFLTHPMRSQVLNFNAFFMLRILDVCTLKAQITYPIE